MRNLIKITMFLLITVNIATISLSITDGWQRNMLQNVVIISLSLQILIQIRDIKVLEKEADGK